MQTPQLYIGTAGWSYKDWVPNFYPKQQTKNFDWLEFYSQYFNTVEVNASYYTYLNPRVVESWLQKTEDIDDFLFTIKLHQDFTHKHNFSKENIKLFQYNLDLLKKSEKLAGLLIQFPYSFHYSESNVEYMRKLIEIFDNYQKFVEVRHKSWQNKKARSVTFCTIDQPQIGKSMEFNPMVGNKTAYIRFHGRNEDAWFNSFKDFGKKQSYQEQSARYEYFYSPGELIEFSQKIKELYDKVKKVFVIMNNHPKGDAVANAFELMHMLKGRSRIKMPPTITKPYPRLREFNQK
ncbi:MAG: DUF72 domain-containing protein [Bacteroidota bacterium]